MHNLNIRIYTHKPYLVYSILSCGDHMVQLFSVEYKGTHQGLYDVSQLAT